MAQQFLKTWERSGSLHAAGLMAPELPGVYVFGEVEHIAGLPTRMEWVYVGRSGNLRRRLRQHDPSHEAHVALGQWTFQYSAISEVWYAVLSHELTRELEADLIRQLQPRLNRVRYSGGRKKK